ncbi:hypothetical protein ACQKWADRAFT_331580 [Trichoderma austrokoningii]
MARQITVIGAKGSQRGSVIRALMKDSAYSLISHHSKQIMRHSKKFTSDDVGIIEADLDDIATPQVAFAGTSIRPLTSKAAAATTLNIYGISDDRLDVPHLSKNKVNDFIKANSRLLQKIKFLWISIYASNMRYLFYQPFPIPTAGKNRYTQLQPSPVSVRFPVIGDATVNIGLFVRAIIEQFNKTIGENFVNDITDVMTAGEMLATWTSVHGVEAEYVQINKATYYTQQGKAIDKMHEYFDWAKESSFSGEDVIFSKEDLGITGLRDTRTEFASMNQILDKRQCRGTEHRT